LLLLLLLIVLDRRVFEELELTLENQTTQ
jgi:hypothetical protein